jgi:type I restriction-modification system DNA methylase subunit
MRPIPVEAVHKIKDQESFIRFLREELGWKMQEEVALSDLSFQWFPEDFELKPDDLRGSRITQLRPFVKDQPWGIFILQLGSSRLYVSDLRKILRGLNPTQRKPKDHPTWPARNLLFLCTPDWKNYTFARFEGDAPESATLYTFGWEYQSTFVRTLCEFNISQLQFPEQEDVFGIDFKAWVDQWSSAFDVKKVTKRFYTEYDDIFRSIKKLLAKQFEVSPKLYDTKPENWTENDEKADEPVHLFVQNLVNRLMFLKFLEKRRWLDFNPNYLSELHNHALADGENFYDKCLYPVFFAGLNRQVDLLVIGKKGVVAKAQPFQDRIGVLPFLNGGLFEKRELDDRIKIPNEVFAGLFGLFSRYNFTINEDTPLDVEVAVNPEMLGKVFEESVIARKEKGAYYTPRNVVSFMCREALKGALVSKCDFSNASAKLEVLIDQHSAQLLADKDSVEVYKALHDLKVLDPAVGSGAFLVGMMFEILEVYKAVGAKLEHDHPYIVQNKLANPRDVYRLKKQIIQNSLFGVDIEEFAVNIARLRLWLSLAVDFPIEFKDKDEFIARSHEIDPLPNLRYKIIRGDSLLAMYRKVSLEPYGRIASGTFAHGRKQRITTKVGEIARTKSEFFGLHDFAAKKSMQTKIDDAMKQLVLGEVKIIQKEFEILAGQESLFPVAGKHKKQQESALREANRLATAYEDLRSSEGIPSDFPVIWDLEFGEVLVDGFDVLIANPPYVRQEELKEIKKDLALHFSETYVGTADLFTYFYVKGIKLLRAGGSLSYISSNKLFRASYGKKLREFLTQNMAIEKIVDFGELPVFVAGVDAAIVVATKGKKPGNVTACQVKQESEIDHVADVVRTRGFHLEQGQLDNSGWTLEPAKTLNLLRRIEGSTVKPLKECVDNSIFYGIKTGLNEAFVVSRSKRAELVHQHEGAAALLRPWLDGHDIQRWYGAFDEKYLIAIPSSANHEWPWSSTDVAGNAETVFEKTYPSIAAHLRPYKRKLMEREDQGQFWWELRSCSYWKQFDKPKLVFNETSRELHAFVDYDELVINKTGFFIVSEMNELLLGILNSRILDFYFRHKFPAWGDPWEGGRVQFRKDRMELVPIAEASVAQGRLVQRIVKYLLWLSRYLASREDQETARDNAMLNYFEQLINGLIYELYLPGEFHAKGLWLFDVVGAVDLPDIDSIEEPNRLKRLRELFEQTYDIKHPIRAAMYDVGSLEIIRAIERRE